MKVYIPEHLKKLKIVKDLADLIREYGEHYYIDNVDSFNDYDYYLKKDPVQKFLSMCINSESIPEDQSLEEIIRYVSKLFYSVKGTMKVFEYIKRYLGLNISGNIFYNTNRVEITIDSINLTDENSFIESFKEFLSALILVQDIDINIPEVNLSLEGTIRSQFGAQAVVYKDFYASELVESDIVT